MAYSSPFRYPGGKRQLTNFIKIILADNQLLGCHYVEPYAGGASVALTLLFHEYATRIHINDLNYQIYSFWHSVLNETDELCSMIHDVEVNMDTWYVQKSIYENSYEHSLLTLGFATFFLNRTNRSGSLNGGVIGGKEQTGKYKIDARFNKSDLIKRIRRISHYRDRISLYNLDAKQLLTDIVPSLPLTTFTYLDPPYYVKGKELYDNHYEHKDHAEIAGLLYAQQNQNWIVSYDNTAPILDLYADSPLLIYGLQYKATTKYEGAEVMFFSDSLHIPRIQNPTKVTPKQVSMAVAA